MNWKAYLTLMRFDKPVGIALLWYPVAWSLWLANQGNPPWGLVGYFFLGTIAMRAAGCVVNDMVDRHIDKHVSRTAKRPLTTGEVGMIEALGILGILLCIAFYVLIHLPKACFFYALIGLLVTVLYPFCKRWIQAPQLMLSIAFSVAIPMVYVASGVTFDRSMVLLILINVLWVLSYDTMYAMVDRADDLRIGVKSTAVLLGNLDVVALMILQGLFHLLWIGVGYWSGLGSWFWGGWGIGLVILILQQKRIAHRHELDCFFAFKFNQWYGLVMWLSLMQNANSWL